jgi:hypothetical protein
MDAIVDQLTIEDLDKPHFLLFLNTMLFEEPLPQNYQLGVGYISLYNKIRKLLYVNAGSVNLSAFSEIK